MKNKAIDHEATALAQKQMKPLMDSLAQAEALAKELKAELNKSKKIKF